MLLLPLLDAVSYIFIDSTSNICFPYFINPPLIILSTKYNRHTASYFTWLCANVGVGMERCSTVNIKKMSSYTSRHQDCLGAGKKCVIEQRCIDVWWVFTVYQKKFIFRHISGPWRLKHVNANNQSDPTGLFTGFEWRMLWYTLVGGISLSLVGLSLFVK